MKLAASPGLVPPPVSSETMSISNPPALRPPSSRLPVICSRVPAGSRPGGALGVVDFQQEAAAILPGLRPRAEAANARPRRHAAGQRDRGVDGAGPAQCGPGGHGIHPATAVRAVDQQRTALHVGGAGVCVAAVKGLGARADLDNRDVRLIAAAEPNCAEVAGVGGCWRLRSTSRWSDCYCKGVRNRSRRGSRSSRRKPRMFRYAFSVTSDVLGMTSLLYRSEYWLPRTRRTLVIVWPCCGGAKSCCRKW